MLRSLWWGSYIIVAIWLQSVLPGFDFFAPGFLISLQEEKGIFSFWLALFFIVLQEGTGSLLFGFSLLQYGMLFFAFYFGKIFFDSRSVTLVVLLNILLSFGHFFFTFFILQLEGMLFPLERVFWESLAQMLVLPFVWYIAHSLVPFWMKQDEHIV